MKTKNLLLILGAIAVVAILIVIYNKKKCEVATKPLVNDPGFETISYKLSADVDPAIFGPSYWAALHDLALKVPCGTCQEFAVKFMIFFHDLVNLKIGKPLFDPTNFAEMSQLITTINLKGNKWPE